MSGSKWDSVENLLPLYAPPLPLPESSNVVVEIGSGNGEATVAIAEQHRDTQFLAVEVQLAGVAILCKELAERDVRNVWVALDDALRLLREDVTPSSLAGVNVFFPDPWPKGRQRHRRLVRPAFAELLATRLLPEAVVHLATDSEPYADQMCAVFAADDHFRAVPPPPRPSTKFERRGRASGAEIRDLAFARR